MGSEGLDIRRDGKKAIAIWVTAKGGGSFKATPDLLKKLSRSPPGSL